jgi:hypothetical protein
MRKVVLIITFSIALCGCSNSISDQQHNISISPMKSIILLPAKWTETTTKTITLSPTLPITETNTSIIKTTLSPTYETLRYYETAYTPIFSYIPPRGWEKVYKPSNSEEAASWTTNNHKCRVNFLMFTGSMTAKEFLVYEMDQAKPDIIISEGTFPNASGLDGYRVIFQFSINEPILYYYAFSQGYHILNPIYSCEGKNNNNENDVLIEETMNSVQFEG